MNGQQQEPPEPKEMDLKAELKRAKINLHNLRIQVLIQESIVNKLGQLA